VNDEGYVGRQVLGLGRDGAHALQPPRSGASVVGQDFSAWAESAVSSTTSVKVPPI